MKRGLTLTTILLIISNISFAQLTEFISGYNGNLFDISFPSPDTGFVVGGEASQSIILKTTDGGANWGTYTNPNTAWLYGVNFVNNNIGYACGWEGVMLKTVDGGTNWTPLTTGTTIWITSIHFLNEDLGYCVGDDGLMLKTIDGGTTWDQQTSNTTNWLLSTFFTGENEGYAVGVGGEIIKTIDGGTTWTALSSGTLEILSDVFFLNDSTGFCAGSNGTILKTTDYGNTWQALSSGTSVHLQSVSFFDANYGYAVGDGPAILKTEDGGNTWVSETVPTSRDLNEVYVDSSSLIIAADEGRVLTGQLALSAEHFSSQPNISLYPNPTSDFVNVELEANYKTVTIEVKNLLGQKVFTQEFLGYEPLRINLAGLDQAIYLVTVRIDETSSYSFEVFKK